MELFGELLGGQEEGWGGVYMKGGDSVGPAAAPLAGDEETGCCVKSVVSSSLQGSRGAMQRGVNAMSNHPVAKDCGKGEGAPAFMEPSPGLLILATASTSKSGNTTHRVCLHSVRPPLIAVRQTASAEVVGGGGS